jgi:hypothetical protein
MCLECWRHEVDELAWCEHCVALLEQPTTVVLNVAASTLAVGLMFLLTRRLPDGIDWAVSVVGVLIMGVVAYKLHRRAENGRLARKVTTRPETPPSADLQSPYRGRLRRVARVVAPPVSGSMAALVAAMLFALVAGVVPTVLFLPVWVEWEIVVVGWWLVWGSAFTVLLYRGWRIAKDMSELRKGDSSDSTFGWGNLADIGDSGCTDPEGCLVTLAGLLLLVVAVALAWVLIELVVPVLFAGAYWFIIRALTHVANDGHDCQGKLAKSMLWGGLWALLYTLPVAGLIWIGHALIVLSRAA